MNSIFWEIYGFEDVKPTAVKKMPDLPMDSDLYSYESQTGAGDALIQKTQDDAFISEILGDRGSSVRIAAPVVELDFLKLLSAADERITQVNKGAPKRRNAIAAIVEQTRLAAPAAIRDCDAWGQLAQSCEKFLTRTLTEV